MMVVNDELERIWKEAVFINCKVIKLTLVSDIIEICSAGFELLHADGETQGYG
jgi:hypothetical protein